MGLGIWVLWKLEVVAFASGLLADWKLSAISSGRIRLKGVFAFAISTLSIIELLLSCRVSILGIFGKSIWVLAW